MITSISEEFGKSRKRGQIKDFEVAYHQLNQFVDKVNDKILNRLQLFQQVYIQDYKQQVTLMSEQLRRLRENLDSQVLNRKSNEKVYILEEERDFFRAQVFKLNQEVNMYLQVNKQLKKTIVDLEVQVTNFKKITFNYQRKFQKLQVQRTQMANFKRQSSVPVLPKYNIKSNESSFEKQAVQNIKNQPKTQIKVNSFEKRAAQTVRTRTFSKKQNATKASLRKYQEANEREQIIDQCIKQAKKEIFYRNTQNKGLPISVQQSSKVNFDKFTRTDKKQLIHKILQNQKMLDQFGQFLVSKSSSESASRMFRTKIGDQKINQKFLSDLKRSFSKKIFDLKANQQTVRNPSDWKKN